MRLVGYVRVSREDENPENQEHAIQNYVQAKGYQLVGIERDVGVSGALPPLEREGFRKVVEKLERKEADGVIVYALDRIARSLWELSTVVKEFDQKGWQIISIREDWLNILDPKIRSLIIAILGWAGEMERELIRERTKEALARLRAEGVKLGRRPKWNKEVRKKILDLVKKGITLKDACKVVGIGYSTAKRYLSKDKEYIKLRMEIRLRRLR
jgi:DNA invertase Pin-like site-specific DNA recombinase